MLSIGQAPSASVAISASFATSASYAPFTQTVQTTIASASWVSASATINTASYAGTASFLVQNRTYNVTSSWSNNSLTASLLGGAPNDFFDKSNWTVPAFATTNSQSMAANVNLLVYINNNPYSFTIGSSITMPSTMLAGNDYGIYATTASGLVATYTNTSSIAYRGYTPPSPYDSTNSRLVGVISGSGVMNAKMSVVFGGLAIVLGIMTWGYKVIETIGSEITRLLPIMALSAQLASAVNVHVYTLFGIPVSTSHSIVGAIVGVGMVRGIRVLNFRIMKDMVLCWLATPFISGIISLIVLRGIKLFIKI